MFCVLGFSAVFITEYLIFWHQKAPSDLTLALLTLFITISVNVPIFILSVLFAFVIYLYCIYWYSIMAVISVRNLCAHINVDGNANIYGFWSADVNRLEKVVETIFWIHSSIWWEWTHCCWIHAKYQVGLIRSCLSRYLNGSKLHHFLSFSLSILIKFSSLEPIHAGAALWILHHSRTVGFLGGWIYNMLSYSPFSNYNWEWRCFDAQLQTCKLWVHLSLSLSSWLTRLTVN